MSTTRDTYTSSCPFPDNISSFPRLSARAPAHGRHRGLGGFPQRRRAEGLETWGRGGDGVRTMPQLVFDNRIDRGSLQIESNTNQQPQQQQQRSQPQRNNNSTRGEGGGGGGGGGGFPLYASSHSKTDTLSWRRGEGGSMWESIFFWGAGLRETKGKLPTWGAILTHTHPSLRQLVFYGFKETLVEVLYRYVSQ